MRVPFSIAALACGGIVSVLGSAAAASQAIAVARAGSEFTTYRIVEPIVTAAVTSYPTIAIVAGDRVIVSAGGCVQTGGSGNTWKRYVDPSGPNATNLYHGLVRIPGMSMTRIQSLVGESFVVPANAASNSLELGYEDDGYGDNGYYSHDDGTDDQCKNVGNAWVVVVVQHGSPVSGPLAPIPTASGVNGLPILATDFQSPPLPPHPVVTPPATWASQVCDGQRWLLNSSPRYEWTNAYDPTNQYDGDAAGLSGLVLFPPAVLANAGLSQDDVPFTHPFGFDWETFVAPDPPFYGLLAPSNTGVSTDTDEAAGEYEQAMQQAKSRGLFVPNGVMGTELDRGLIPPVYRAADGDRLALFGRLIVDCGHADFHTEIHPPLLFVRARAIAAGTSPDAGPTTNGTITYSRVISRPFLTGQEFGDGALRTHLEKEVAKALAGVGPIADSNRIEAHPLLNVVPTSNIHLFSYSVRAPVLPPAQNNALRRWTLVCSYHFTTRSGVAVQIVPTASDTVKVFVTMNAATYVPATVPIRHDLNVTFSQLKSSEPDVAKYVDGILAVGALTRGAFDGLIARGILTDQYDAPIAASESDANVTSVPIESLGGQQFSVDNAQPFPVYGWLSLEWRPGFPVIQQPVVH